MSDNYKNFLETLDANGAKFAIHYAAIGDEDYTNCTVEQIESVIAKFTPQNHRAITTICYIMSIYAKFIGNEKMVEAIKEVDRNRVWNSVKHLVSKRFISNKQFVQTYEDVLKYEDHNNLYKATLFQAIYEGVYSDDTSVLTNLRKSDIHGNILTLRPNGKEPYELEVSSSLVENLTKLSTITTWERKNKYSLFEINIYGDYPDTCFKVETRAGDKDNSNRHKFYRLIRNICKDYLEYPVTHRQLFVSGLMFRICENLTAAGRNAEEAFLKHNNKREVSNIIKEEMDRCHYSVSVMNFKEYLRGNYDVFFGEGTESAYLKYEEL